MDHDEQWDDSLLIEQYDSSMNNIKKLIQPELLINSGQTKQSKLVNGVQSRNETTKGQKSKAKSTQKHKDSQPQEWTVGSYCCAPYSDGYNYEATILKISGNQVTVDFHGYNETAIFTLTDLQPSEGKAARKAQYNEARTAYEEYAEEDNNEIYNRDERDSVYHANEDSYESSSERGSRSTERHQCMSHDMGHEHHHDDEHTMHSPHHHHHGHGHSHSSRHNHCNSQNDLPFDGLPDIPPPPLLASGSEMNSEMLHTMLMSWYMTGYHTGYYKGYNAAQQQSSSSSSGHRKNRPHYP